MEGDSAQIREHYNRIEDRGMDAREQSAILNIRNTNNFIKACLIRQYVRRGDSVLDLACGKGGDLLKYEKAGILEYCGVDIADGSINDARVRFKKMKRRFRATFKTLDAFNQPMSLNKTFNVISAQFSFHYAFSSDQSVDVSLNNVSNHLRPGGYFIMTIPCRNAILEKFKSGSMSNEFYSIEFPNGIEIESCREYHFSLTDSVNNCIEYLVDFQKMVDGFRKLGLNLVKQQGFISFYEDESEKNPELFKKMRLRNLTEKEKEVVEIYQVVVLQKSGRGGVTQ